MSLAPSEELAEFEYRELLAEPALVAHFGGRLPNNTEVMGAAVAFGELQWDLSEGFKALLQLPAEADGAQGKLICANACSPIGAALLCILTALREAECESQRGITELERFLAEH